MIFVVMNIRKRFKTKKYWYSWGNIYDLKTEEKMKFITSSAYCRADLVWITTYQESKDSLPKVIRYLFVDE